MKLIHMNWSGLLRFIYTWINYFCWTWNFSVFLGTEVVMTTFVYLLYVDVILLSFEYG